MIEIKTMFKTYKDCYLDISKYVCDGRIAIQAWNMEDGPIATLTVCLDDHRRTSLKDETYIDTNNCPFAPGLLKKYGIATETGKFGFSGYCCYPLMKINMEETSKHVYVEKEVEA